MSSSSSSSSTAQSSAPHSSSPSPSPSSPPVESTSNHSPSAAESTGAGTGVTSKPKPESLKSSYYHFSSTPAAEFERYKPQPISSPPPTTPTPQLTGVSSWNAAGTWEEKDCSKWAQERITHLLKQVSIPHEHGSITIATVNKASGDATVVFTRGKKKVGVDLQINCEWNATYKKETITGTIEIPNVDETSLDDYEVNITVKESSSGASYVHGVLKNHGRAAVHQTLEQLIKELREQ